MLPTAATADEVQRRFRWIVPTVYNIAVDACHKWAAAAPERPAILQATRDGRVDVWSFERLSRAANRVSNVLVAHG
ncbi:MAG: AMP-dependent synthetase, partial [Phyllobacteriaceae bacterium]|nr:AMP-dependent synthetase [Phyllobacteriaceae bacterium]